MALCKSMECPLQLFEETSLKSTEQHMKTLSGSWFGNTSALLGPFFSDRLAAKLAGCS